MALSNPLDRLFGRSPFRPMQEHMSRVHECATALVPFVELAISGDWAAAEVQQRQVAELERAADELKREVRRNLPQRMFLPVGRADLLSLLSAQDAVANLARDIAGIMLGRQMQVPPEMSDDLLAFVKLSVAAVEQATRMLHELDELLETGFWGRELKRVEAMYEKLDDVEHDTDETEVRLRARLRELEANLPPVDVMFLYKILDDIGGLADRAHKVGSRLELMLVN